MRQDLCRLSMDLELTPSDLAQSSAHRVVGLGVSPESTLTPVRRLLGTWGKLPLLLLAAATFQAMGTRHGKGEDHGEMTSRKKKKRPASPMKFGFQGFLPFD